MASAYLAVFPSRNRERAVQWGNDLVFKAGGKMFAIAPLEPGSIHVSLNCSAADFAELVEYPGIIPAPYLARAQWVALEDENALTSAETRRFIERAHQMVFEKLPRKARAALTSE